MARNKLVAVSVLVLIYREILVFLLIPYRCNWPALPCPDTLRAAVIGDPQLTDRFSYWFAPSGIVLWAIEQLSDVFMRKAFHQVLEMRPQAVMFVGDLMDGTVRLNDEDYERELARFHHVFPMPGHVQRVFVAGNHDVGIRSTDLCPVCRRRFEKHFALRKFAKDMLGVTVVGMDSIQVFHNSSMQGMNVAACQPKILLSHVPLWRPNDSPCGVSRGSAEGIKFGQGFNYENILPRSVTENLLRQVEPDLILSGDDHDHCHHVHEYESNAGRKQAAELTVGTFSWLQGNPRPSVLLLSLSPCAIHQRSLQCARRQRNRNATEVDGEQEEVFFNYSVCPLPQQLSSVLFYLAWLPLSVLALFAFHLLNRDCQKMRKRRLARFSLKIRAACILTFRDAIRSYSLILIFYGCLHLFCQLF